MKSFANSMLRKIGLQLVRTETIDSLRSEVIRFREAAPYLENVYGHKMFVDHSDVGLRLAPLVGLPPDKGEAGWFVRTIKPGQTVIDLGANVGLYTLLFGRLVGPSGQVIGFEPGPKSFKLLSRNIEENGYRNIRAENAAVADKTGRIDLYVCKTGESDNRVEGAIDPGNDWERVSVPCFAIDDYFGDQRVDFIKMDIQGSEYPALRGMRNTLIRNSAIQLVVEFTPSSIVDMDGFFNLIKEIGFSLFDVNDRSLTRERLLATVGNTGQIAHTNIVLRR
jgi:FkbM family methyltransferase